MNKTFSILMMLLGSYNISTICSAPQSALRSCLGALEAVPEEIDIAGLDKVQIFLVLHKRAMRDEHICHNPFKGIISYNSASKYLKTGIKVHGLEMVAPYSVAMWDGVHMHIDLSGSLFDPTGFNKIYGDNSAQRIIGKLKKVPTAYKQPSNEVEQFVYSAQCRGLDKIDTAFAEQFLKDDKK